MEMTKEDDAWPKARKKKKRFEETSNPTQKERTKSRVHRKDHARDFLGASSNHPNEGADSFREIGKHMTSFLFCSSFAFPLVLFNNSFRLNFFSATAFRGLIFFMVLVFTRPVVDTRSS